MYDELLQKAERHHLLMHETNYNWMRTVLTILIPSLVLLIGLKSAPPADQVIARYLLVATITLIALTTLIGFYALRGESVHHDIAHRTFLKQAAHNSSRDGELILETLPNRYYIPLVAFPYLVVLSLLTLTAFGIVKTLSLG